MSEANPLVLKNTLEETLRRYIATTVPIHSRYSQLYSSFWNSLNKESLVEGPYIETVPDFEKGRALNEFLNVNGGPLNDAFTQLGDDLINRRLHLHQDKALTKACIEKKNLVVATGTGSGKTETFLYPIVNEILNDPEFDKPGVRVILIYPMNALANDQLNFRIAPLLGKQLRDQNITFGRYTGQTKKAASRSEVVAEMLNNVKLDEEFDGEIPDNWLVTREEMLKTPPKILVTNYAMLEHLLLLPVNAPLFENCKLKSLVLDEVHTYNGSQATEVAMLLRKLKNRLGVDYPVQYFATSASLGDSEESELKLKTFASHLFGEAEPEIVRGKRITHSDILRNQGASFTLGANHWKVVSSVFDVFLSDNSDADDQDGFNFISTCEDHGLSLDALLTKEELELIDGAENQQELSQALFTAFSRNLEVQTASEHLHNGVIHFTELANLVFANSENDELEEALTGLVKIGIYAKSSTDSFPLLPCKHHLIASAIEGSCVSLDNSEEGFNNLELRSHHQTKDEIFYPLLTCRQCGQPYIEGYLHNSTLHNRYPSSNSNAQRKIFWLGKPASYENFDEEDEAECGGTKKWATLNINPVNGDKVNNGGVKLYELKTEDDEFDKTSYLKHCAACNSKASGSNAEIITRFYPGNESLSSVVTQKVLEALPAKKNNQRPAAGRKLLTFSDNRQDAAFFAPYFERTANDFAHRGAIVEALQDVEHSIPFDTLANKIRATWDKRNSFSYPDANGQLKEYFEDVKDILTGKLAAEFCTPPGRRTSLEALGLVDVAYSQKKMKDLVGRLAKEFSELDRSEIETLCLIFLEHIRRSKAVINIPNDVDIKSATIWGERYRGVKTFELERAGGEATHSFITQLGSSRNNRRTWYLVNQLGWDQDLSRRFLSTVWECLTKKSKFLKSSGGAYALDASFIELKKGRSEELKECNVCGLKQKLFIRNKCTAFGCHGEVGEPSADKLSSDINHYIHSYTEVSSQIVRAREHTASLSTALREEIESEFFDSKVNVLSCTTTMEVGVDLGDLEAIVNLNVPPGVANYQQRTGRAGRRAQAAPFCVTVARNSKHDRVVFGDFKGYLKRSPPEPFVNLTNKTLIQRHQLSVLLSKFLGNKLSSDELKAPKLVDLFGIEIASGFSKEFRNELLAWLETENGKVATDEANRILEKLPSKQRAIVESQIDDIKVLFVSELENFAQLVEQRCVTYLGKIEDARQKIIDGDNDASKELARWIHQRDSYLGQFLVNKLSENGLIPTYSFPIHSLTLEVTQKEKEYKNQFLKSDVELVRDASLGISEYAPGSEVIANGRIWRSAGLAYSPRDFMPTNVVTICRTCNHANVAECEEDKQTVCENCKSPLNETPLPFIKPKGFITAFKDSKGKDPSSTRKRSVQAEEAKLIVVPSPEQYEQSDHSAVFKMFMPAYSKSDISGRLFILNKGFKKAGYLRCPYCNYMTSRESKSSRISHEMPETGKKCPNQKLQPTSLAHEFHTDVAIYKVTIPISVDDISLSDEQKTERKNNIAVTLSEALRLAFVEMLEVPISEIRSLFRFENGALILIAYDGVPGGAGYVSRIFETISTKEILEKVIQILDCQNDCETGCINCICDYSNQKYWDSFLRKEASLYVNGLIDDFQYSHPIQKLGAVKQKSTSFQGLIEQFEKFEEVIFTMPHLVDSSSFDKRDLDWLINLLSKVKVKILLLNELPNKFENTPASLRAAIDYLKPYISDGVLDVSHISTKLTDEQLMCIPFAIGLGKDEEADSLWFGNATLNFNSNNKVCGEIYQLAKKDYAPVVALLLSNLEKNRYSPDYFSSRSPFGVFPYRSNETRNLETVFDYVEGKHINCLHIRDPYLASDNSIKYLGQLLSTFCKLTNEVERIKLDCRMMDNSDDYRDYESKVANTLINECNFDRNAFDISVFPANHRRGFHDRRVSFEIINSDGASETVVYELSGGVSHLLNSNYETCVTMYRVEDYGS